MARQWKQISLEDAKKHPLYGIKNWLAGFGFLVLVGPLVTIGQFSNAAHQSGLTLPQLLSADIATGAFIKATIAFNLTLATIFLWLLFSKHRNFRVTSIALLVMQWPAYLIVVLTTGGTQIPGLGATLTINFLSSLLLIAIWVAYLQRSRRVRVTFENTVLVERAEEGANPNKRRPSNTAQTTHAGNAAYAEALAEVEEGRMDKGVWARAYAESGGDESKAKAAYIKSRAVSIHRADEWSNTLPLEDTRAGRAESPVSNTKAAKAGNSLLTTVWLSGGVAGAFIFAAVALPAYQDYSKRRVSAATPVQAPAPKAGAGMFDDLPSAATLVQAPATDGRYGANDKPVPNAQTATDWSQFTITPPPVKVDEANNRAFTYEEATAPKTQSTVEQEHYRRIYAAHPDADAIHDSPTFKTWVAKYPTYQRIVAKGTAQEVIEMLTAYKNQR